MKFDQLTVLLPCLSLEDFTLQRPAREAEQLLGAWSALWHPALLASARVTPAWHPAEDPPLEPSGYLIIAPEPSEALLQEGWLEGAEQGGACVIRGLQRREEMVAAALEQLNGEVDAFDPELVADFHALGFCHFQVELLTRQLRYMSNLDEESFRVQLLLAVDAAAEGDGEEARRKLQSTFDLLHEAREYFYPVEAHLLDLTLVASTTMGASLREELSSPLPTNLMISGEVIEKMAQKEPETLEMLRDAIGKETASVIGGEYRERALPLLGPESIRENLCRGLAAYEKHLGARPTVFGRRRFGLLPTLPGLLKQLDFSGIVHSTLDDGRFPTGNQSRIQWEGIDATVRETLARVPTDISRADAFLRLPEQLSNSMDLDHVATIVLAHWPGQSNPWYEDLKRIAGYTSAVGAFSTINRYFEETFMAGQQARYEPDQYRSPYLAQEVAAGRADPISRWARYHRRRAAADCLQGIRALGNLMGTQDPAEQDPVKKLIEAVEDTESDNGSLAEGEATEIDARLDTELQKATAALGKALSGGSGAKEGSKQGRILVNPWSFSQRTLVDVSDFESPPDVETPVRAVDNDGGKVSAIVDVPAMGFAWVAPGGGSSADKEPPERHKRKAKRQQISPPLAEENCLQNDFLRVVIDPHTGAIRSISDYHTRGARLAQQIALRLPSAQGSEGEDTDYSIMAADELTVTSSGPLVGEIVVRGRLVDRHASQLARFTQTTQVRRGSPIIDVRIDLDINQPPEPNPWHSYYAARFAWGDAGANLYRGVGLSNVPTETPRIEAPGFIDIRSPGIRTTLLTAGLPYHRRFGLRKLDSLLVVRGETARSFRFGIGIDVPHPVSASLDFLAPNTPSWSGPSPSVASGWLFHLDHRNVTSTRWEPWFDEGRLAGFRVRLLETDGQKTELGLRSFRPVATAEKIRPGDTAADALAVDGDRITIPLGPHEWAEVEARFVGSRGDTSC